MARTGCERFVVCMMCTLYTRKLIRYVLVGLVSEDYATRGQAHTGDGRRFKRLSPWIEGEMTKAYGIFLFNF